MKQIGRFSLALLPALLLGLCIGATQVHATPITTLFNTGVAADGTVLAGGAVDPHYTLIASGDPDNPGPNAIVADPIPDGFWDPNSSTSKWISPSVNQAYNFCCESSGNPPFGPGGVDLQYIYRTTFDLTGFDAGSAFVQGSWGADNKGLDILINGISTGQTTNDPGYGWGTQFFTISSGFVQGLNTLTFVTTNYCCDVSNPTGLHVKLSSAVANVVPVPPAVWLFGSALGLMGAVRRKVSS